MSALKLSDAGPVQFTYVLAEIFDFMSVERRSEVIEWTLANRYKVPEAARTAFNSSIDGAIRINGFSDANASAAPGPLLKEPLLLEAPFSPEIAHNILSVWRKSRPDLRQAVVSALRVNGVIEDDPGSLPKEIRFDPPHPNVIAAIADVGRTWPEFKLDDVALMTALVTGAVPDTSRMTEKVVPPETEAVAEVIQDDWPNSSEASDEESSPDVKAMADDIGMADAPESKNSRAASDLLLEALQQLPPDAPDWNEAVPELIKAISNLRENKLAEYTNVANLDSRIAEVLESHAETLAFFEWDGETRLLGHQAPWNEAAAVRSAVDALAYLLHRYETIRDLGATYSEETQRSRMRVDLQEQIIAALAVLELLAPRPADSPPEDAASPDTAPTLDELNDEPHTTMNGASPPPHTALYLEEPETGPKTQHRAPSTTPFLEKSFATTNGAPAPPHTAPSLEEPKDEPHANMNGASPSLDTAPSLEETPTNMYVADVPLDTTPSLEEALATLNSASTAPETTSMPDAPPANMYVEATAPDTTPPLEEPVTNLETQVDALDATPAFEEPLATVTGTTAPLATTPSLDEPDATPSLDATSSEPSTQDEDQDVEPSPSEQHADSDALVDQPAIEEDSDESAYEPLHSQNGNMQSAAGLADTDYPPLSQQFRQLLQTEEASAEAAPQSPSAFTNIGDVLDYAEGMWPGLLQIALNRRSERMMYFDKPRQVFDALQWLATTYYRSRSGEEAQPDLDNSVFEACGWRYKQLQPPVAGGKYRSDYETTYGGRTHTLHEHIGRGAGQTPNQIRLAFAWDADRRVVVVGYIGHRQRTDAT